MESKYAFLYVFILSKKYIPTYFAIVLSSFRYLVIMSCIVSFIVDLLLVDISTCVSADNNHFVHLWNLTSHPKHWRHACKEEYEDYCNIVLVLCVTDQQGSSCGWYLAHCVPILRSLRSPASAGGGSRHNISGLETAANQHQHQHQCPRDSRDWAQSDSAPRPQQMSSELTRAN